MAAVHLLNVSPGDCTIIQHASGRVTMLDICDGNLLKPKLTTLPVIAQDITEANTARTTRRMCNRPTNPIDYARTLGINSIYRFILSHPDMDHLDGFDRLAREFAIHNFWDSTARKSEKPDFGAGCPYREEDWDRYVHVRDGHAGTNSLEKLEGATFKYANAGEEGESGDGLHILSPDAALVPDPDEDDDLNDASYVILYHSIGGRIVLPGDAHDGAWNHVLANHAPDVKDCSFLLAPHHGRGSDRSYDFLDVLRPKLTLIGCCPSEYIDYDEWHNRGLKFITSNQAGNVVLDLSDGYMDVFVENESFAKAESPRSAEVKNGQGYSGYTRIRV